MTPLRALILGQMEARRWDPKDVEERGIAHATLHRYMNPLRMKTLPRSDVLTALATSLDLPLERVRQAAWESLEGNIGPAGGRAVRTRSGSATPSVGPPAEDAADDLEILTRLKPGLSPEQRREARERLRAIVRAALPEYVDNGDDE